MSGMTAATLNKLRIIATDVCTTRGKWSPFRGMKYYSTSSHLLDISGVYPPIPTPFDAKGDVNYVQLERNFTHWNKIPFAGESQNLWWTACLG